MDNEPDENPPTATGIDLELLRALLANQPKPMPWAAFIASIDAEYKPPACALTYYRMFLQTVETLTALGVKTTFDLTPELIRKFIEARPPDQSPWTLRSALIRVRTICNQAVRHRRLLVSPFVILPIGKIVRLGKPIGRRHLDRPEISRLLEVLRADIEATKGWAQWKARRLYIVVCLGLYCALRKNELLRLKLADIDLAARVIRLVANNASGKLKTQSSEQPVPIAPALMPILVDYMGHRLDHPRGAPIDLGCEWLIPTCNRKAPWTSGAPGSKPLDRLKAIGKRAGIGHITMHMLRRSCATHLEASGVPRSMVARILRHNDERGTEQFYLRADEEAMLKAVEGFEY